MLVDPHVGRIDAGEPAAQPVVALIIDHIQKRRRGDDQVHRPVSQAGCPFRRPGHQDRRRMRRRHSVRQQAERLLQDDRPHVPRRRHLAARLVDLALRHGRHGLIGRHGIDREKPARMAGQTIDRHHPDPGIHRIERIAPLQQPGAQGADLTQGVRDGRTPADRPRPDRRPRVERSISASRLRTAATGGGSRRGPDSIALNGLTSFAAGARPISAACTAVVPRPENGSNTRSPGLVRRSMKNAGSCDLKQAR